MHNPGRLLVLIIISESLGASACYAMTGDVRRAVYWLAAAVLNLAVTL